MESSGWRKKKPGSERTDKLGDGAVRKMTPFWLQEEARSSTRNFLGMSKHKYLMCLKILTCKKDSRAETTAVGTQPCARYPDAQISIATNADVSISTDLVCLLGR